MALPKDVHELWKKLYEEAEKSPDKQTSTRVNFKGREYKLRIQLSSPDWREGTILVIMEPRPKK